MPETRHIVIDEEGAIVWTTVSVAECDQKAQEFATKRGRPHRVLKEGDNTILNVFKPNPYQIHYKDAKGKWRHYVSPRNFDAVLQWINILEDSYPEIREYRITKPTLK